MNKKKRLDRMTGQGLVEYALILPLVLILIFGILEFGRIIAVYNESFNATRNALRYSIVHPTDCAGIAGVARQSLKLIDPNTADVIVELDNGQDPANGGQIVASCPIANPDDLVIEPGWRVRVRLETDLTPMTPLISNIFSSLPLSYSGARTIFNEAGVVQELPPSGKVEGAVTYWGNEMVMTTTQQEEPRPIEVINVMDVSLSMDRDWQGGTGGQPKKIQSAKEALVMFNNLLDPDIGDVVGLVAFPGTEKTVASYPGSCGGSYNKTYVAKVKSGLTSNIAQVNSVVNSLSTMGYTPLADALRKGRETLVAGHAEGKTPVLIAASDGMANVRPGASNNDPVNGKLTGFGGMDPVSPPCNAEAHNGAIYEGVLTRDQGIVVATIAIGDGFNSEALQTIASPGFFFQVVSQAELEAAFEEIRTAVAYVYTGEVCTSVVRNGARARVTLDDGQGHAFTTIANDAGQYTLYNIPYGQYTVTGSGSYNGTTYDITTDGVGGDPLTVVIDLQGDSLSQDIYLTTATQACTP